MNNPIACDITPQTWLMYRAKRQKKGISPKTLNTELGHICAVFNFLKKAKVIEYVNPLDGTPKIKMQERALDYLTTEQIIELRKEVKNSKDSDRLLAIVDLCLATGARWSEAESITKTQIQRDRVTYTNTKSKRTRTVQISPTLSKRLTILLPLSPRGTRIEAIRRVLSRCSFTLPKGQASHVLRHTLASHFIINGGNVLLLQKMLGHQSINMTMRYAHLAPDYAADAVKYNPIGHFLDKEESGHT